MKTQHPNRAKRRGVRRCRAALPWQRTSTVTWFSPEEKMPSSHPTLLLYIPVEQAPVWLGFRDGADWRSVDGELIRERVVLWAYLPSPKLNRTEKNGTQWNASLPSRGEPTAR